MKPISFKHQNAVLAKDQPQYLPLPVHCSSNEVISCWKMGFLERVKVLFTGLVWVRIMNFGNPLQPQSLEIRSPFQKSFRSFPVQIAFWIWKHLAGGEVAFYENPALKKFKAPICPPADAWRGWKLKIWKSAVDYLVKIGELTYTPTITERF